MSPSDQTVLHWNLYSHHVPLCATEGPAEQWKGDAPATSDIAKVTCVRCLQLRRMQVAVSRQESEHYVEELVERLAVLARPSDGNEVLLLIADRWLREVQEARKERSLRVGGRGFDKKKCEMQESLALQLRGIAEGRLTVEGAPSGAS